MMTDIVIKIRRWLRKWLGIEILNDRVSWSITKTEDLARELHDQVNMVGIDAHLSKHQSEIIIISNLAGGSVHIKPAYFRSVSELVDFVRYLDHTFGERRIILDSPVGPSAAKMISELRRQGDRHDRSRG